MKSTTRYVAVAMAVAFGISGGCGSCRHDDDDLAQQRVDEADGKRRTVGSTGPGLSFRLSDGAPQRADRPPVATAAPLGAADLQHVLARMPPLQAAPDDEKDFALREASLPPPKTGVRIKDQFPPPASDTPPDGAPSTGPTAPASGPLTVLRRAPDGDVPIAPHLQVSFSQPMVAVTSHDDLAKLGVPVKLSPEPRGKWRWVGTKTLLFEPAPRFPMATTYSVEVPAGTKSATGGTLAAAERWTFSTPPPRMQEGYPTYGPQRLDPLLFVSFDQKIDPAAVLATITLDAKGKRPVRLATAKEIEGDEQIALLVKRAQADRAKDDVRWLAFRPTALLPGDTEVKIAIGPGTPSAEGPRKTEDAQGFGFRTYGPLAVTEHQCYAPCPPGQPWTVRFSNPLDVKQFELEQLRVEPAVPRLKAAVYGNQIYLYGQTKARTNYKVTLTTALTDEFGQHLEKDTTVDFEVGPAQSVLTGPGKWFTVADPAAKAHFSVFSINHKTLQLRILAVTPADYQAYLLYLDEYYRRDRTPELPGRVVVNETITVAGDPDMMTETRIDLARALAGKHGQLIVNVEEIDPAKDKWERQRVNAWVQVTDIALDAFADYEQLVVWATNLADGKPLADVAIELTTTTGNVKQSSAADGLATLRLPAPPTSSQRGGALLIARKGDDLAILPESGSYYHNGGSWWRHEPYDALRWHIFDDRAMYRPGETVHVKGWVRKLNTGKNAELAAAGFETVAWRIMDSQGNEIGKGDAALTPLGGFDLTYQLPPTVNLGYTQIRFAFGGYAREAFHSFRVEEFRRPEYEVSTATSAGPYLIGGSADVTVSAAYFAGGGLKDAQVSWSAMALPGFFTPPNRADYSFGTWTPWWSSGPSRHSYRGGPGRGRHGYGGGDDEDHRGPQPTTFPARTNGSGEHHLHIDFDAVAPVRPMTLTVAASVTDVNRQAWSASARLLVHPSSLYVGLKTERTFVDKGKPIEVDGIVVDLEGKAVGGRTIAMHAVRLESSWQGGEYQVEEMDPEDCKVPSGTDAVRCRFQPKEGGSYRITATIEDEQQRPNQSELMVWVAGEKLTPSRDVDEEEITLVPDKKDYQPGDTARVLVRAPFAPAEGVLSLRRDGIVEVERFTMKEATITLSIPITEAHLTNVGVKVDLVGAAVRLTDDGAPDPGLPKRPAFAAGELNLSVPALGRKLAVTVTPADKGIAPAGETDVDVVVKDSGGKPVAGAELAVVMVDEAVLALTSYQLADPLGSFYTYHPDGATDVRLRTWLLLAHASDLKPASGAAIPPPAPPGAGDDQPGGTGTKQALEEGKMGRRDAGRPAGQYAMKNNQESPKADRVAAKERAANAGVLSATGAGGREPAPQIAVRSNFDPLALFAPSVPTDAEGHARVHVKVPDNLTRYRVMVVAVSGEQRFGVGEAAITARLPLMVRPSAPRFLNFGDTFEFPVVVQNQTDQPMVVDVALRASNATLADGAGAAGRRVTVPAQDRVEVRFPAAAKRAGIARFQVGAVSGKWADAGEIALPVWTPATTEAFATYGEIDAPGATIQPVAAPANVVQEFGGLEITTSSTALAALTDAVLYLVSYRFECAEQISSRVLAVAALKDVLGAFKAEGLPTAAEMIAAMDRDLDRLKGLQNYDGGFAFWERDRESWPYISVHVAHALARARQKGFAVPPEMITRSLSYLRDVESHIPSYYSLEARRAIMAYAVYARAQLGDPDRAYAGRVLTMGPLDDVSLETAGWLLAVLPGDKTFQPDVTRLLRHVQNRVTETAGMANFVDRYGDGAYLILHSDRRADGVVLEGLIAADPKSDLIPKVVRGLMAHRKAGHWGNTQENAFVLLALDRYFQVYEKVTPDFVASAWLGDKYAGKHAFRGRTTEQHEIAVPMRYLADAGGTQNLILDKQGGGRLYYRIGMRYAPADLILPAADHGFTVERQYESVDDPKDVTRDQAGVWHVKAGARVRVRLTMVAESRRYHVALVDPLPAGLEAMNPALAVTGTVPQDPKQQTERGWYWRGPWYEHQNLRDERVEAFTTLLWEGVWTYSYVARATTPGRFVVPPAKAEEMYAPETFGRSAGDKLFVE